MPRKRAAYQARGCFLAGLIDAGGPKAFGNVMAEDPEKGRVIVDHYHRAGFQPIKLYTYLRPDVVKAICTAAHRLGMTDWTRPASVNHSPGHRSGDGPDQPSQLRFSNAARML